MTANAADALYVPGDSSVHRLPPQCKVLAAVLMVLAVVATPREQLWAFAQHAFVLGVVVTLAGLPPRLVLRRMAVEIPFVAFALLLPFVATGERVEVGPVAMAADGLWAAWNIVAKASLGVLTAVALTSTTPVAEVLRGLDRLRVPRPVTAIAGFMVRYVDVVAGDLHRMRIARLARGHDPRWFWQAGAVARSAGVVFVRSFERGERVFLAMQSRGYAGVMPDVGGAAGATRYEWMGALVPVVTLMAVAGLAATVPS